MRALIAGALFFALAGTPLAQTSAEIKDWVAHCISQISETNKARAEAYCACMAESVDTSEKLRQTDLERSFPPVHQFCFRKAGFKIPN